MQTAVLNFFQRWLSYHTETFDDQQHFFTKRREILLSRILFISAFTQALITVKDFFVMRASGSVYIDLVILLIILLSFRMVQTGFQKIAKSFFLILMNSFTVFYAGTLPMDRGIFLYFFPLITMAFAIFEEEEVSIRIAFILLPIFLLILLVLTDFDLFGSFKLATSRHGKYNFVINSIVTTLMVAFFVEFMMKANRKSEKLLRQLAGHVQQKKEDIEKINKELDRFVYSASHDLRAPLSSIQGITKLALMGPDRTHDLEYFRMIKNRTGKLDEFINEIIDYSRNSRTELRHELTDVGELINEAIVNLQFLDHADRIRFEINNTPGKMMLDKGRMKMVVNNLVSNAIKYQNLRSEQSWVKVDVLMEGAVCKINIEDNGIGIAKEFQGRIFEMFFRATERSSGSGLGLYIVKEIIERMKGSIKMKSDEGKGTRFEMAVPIGD